MIRFCFWVLLLTLPFSVAFALESSKEISSPIKSATEFTVNLHAVRFADLAAVVYGDILHRSYTLDKDLVDSPDTVSINWQKLNRSQIDALMLELAKNRGFDVLDRHGSLFLQKQLSQEHEEEKVQEEIFIYKPKYRTSRYLTDIVQSVTEARSMTNRQVRNDRSQNQLQNTGQVSQAFVPPTSAAALLDRADSDQLVLNVPKKDLPKVQKLLADIDLPQSEVVLKAAVYEVGSTKGEGGAFRVLANMLKGKLGASIGNVPASSNTLTLASSGLEVVLAAIDQDSRFKTLSRPMVRVRSGAQARFSVGQDVPVLGQAQLDKNGNPISSIEYRQSGVILTVTPDIHDQAIDLDISQELSTFIATTTGVNNSPTLLKRTVDSKLSLRPGEVVIFAGLNETKDDETQSRFFNFNVGHHNNQTESEILVLVEAQRI